MFQESHGFNIGHGEFTHVAGDYHGELSDARHACRAQYPRSHNVSPEHNTNYAPGVPVNNIGTVTNANFGTNYGAPTPNPRSPLR